MLKNTFLHISGIGIKTEQRFWESGIHNWNDFAPDYPIRLSPKRLETICEHLQESKQNIKSNNPSYFSERLPVNFHWRFFPEFRNSTAYLDIETNGLDRYFSTITTITLYDGKSIFTYVKDQNLDDFPEDIRKYKVLVTYNGKCFDVPFIESYFGICLNHVHIDLRYILGSLGFKGGLKGCEMHLGIERGDLKDIDGFLAVLLWQDYQKKKNQKALETLLAYNIQDTVTLETLMVIAYSLKLKNTPFAESHQLLLPVLPENPFKVDRETVEMIERTSGYECWGY